MSRVRFLAETIGDDTLITKHTGHKHLSGLRQTSVVYVLVEADSGVVSSAMVDSSVVVGGAVGGGAGDGGLGENVGSTSVKVIGGGVVVVVVVEVLVVVAAVAVLV